MAKAWPMPWKTTRLLMYVPLLLLPYRAFLRYTWARAWWIWACVFIMPLFLVSVFMRNPFGLGLSMQGRNVGLGLWAALASALPSISSLAHHLRHREGSDPTIWNVSRGCRSPTSLSRCSRMPYALMNRYCAS